MKGGGNSDQHPLPDRASVSSPTGVDYLTSDDLPGPRQRTPWWAANASLLDGQDDSRSELLIGYSADALLIDRQSTATRQCPNPALDATVDCVG